MSKNKKIALGAGLVCFVVIVAVAGYLLSQHTGQQGLDQAEVVEVQGTEESGAATQVSALELSCEAEMAGKKVSAIQDWIYASVYDEDAQAAIASELEAAKDGQTLAEPLVFYDPFGTNTQSLYVYFVTEQAASVAYTVHVDDEDAATIEDESFVDGSIDDFTRSVDDGAFTQEHEFQAMGLIPNVVNTVTITATYEDGSVEYCTVTCDVGDVLGDEALQLEVTEGTSDAELEDGLYVILGNDSDDADFMYYYDNQGILRGEVPVIGYRSHRMLFDDEGTMYYSASQSRMAAMNTLGQITHVYYLGDYDLHHDYVWGEDGQLLVLATDTSRDDSDEDLVISLDIGTGEVTELVDMGDLLATYKEEAFAYHEANYEPEEGEEDEVAGWMHVNSIQYIASEDAMLLSSRETSTIFKISNATSGQPAIEYMLASELFWEGTEYEDYLFEQVGDFIVHGGQHCLVYVEDDSLQEGQYYLQFYNNNLGMSASTTNDFDYAGAGIGGEDASSYYYMYLVDENERTFELVDSLEVPYSGYVSSVQWVGDNLIIDSGTLGYYTEYDADYEPICSFSMGTDKFIYRVFKYDL